MSLRYLTNTNPPPPQSLLEYDIQPGVVFISTGTEPFFVNLTVTVTNTTNAPIDCREFQLAFLAGAATGNLTTAAEAGAVTATSDQDAWSITTNGSFSSPSNQNLYLFTARPAGVAQFLPLAAGANLVFHLNDILIDQSVGEGTAPFTIIEQTGTSKATKQTVLGTLPIEKEKGSLAITAFNVDPPTPIPPGTPIELSWILIESDHWQLFDLDTSTLLYDSRTSTPPNLTQWPVEPQQLTPLQNTTYELIAWAGEIFTTARAIVQVTNSRFVNPLPTANPQTVDSGGESILSWATVHAEYVIVTAEEFTSGRIDSSSGQGSCPVNPITATLYTLTTYSSDDQGGDVLYVQVDVNKAAIVSFTASSESFTKGQPILLSWQTKSVSSATLAPGDVSVPVNAENYAVSPPKGRVVYRLTGTGQETVHSDPIVVTQTLETFTTGAPLPQRLAYDGTYIWVLHSVGSLTRLLARDGSQQGSFSVPSFLSDVIYAGDYIWLSNEVDQEIIRMSPADGSNRETFQLNDGPQKLSYDDTYIWADGLDHNTVTRLLVADGSNQGAYQVAPAPAEAGPTPNGLVADGKYVWVAEDNYVVRLHALDGSQQGTFPVGDIFDTIYDLISDRTTYIWATCGNTDAGTGVVTRLLAADGSNQGNFSVGSFPIALAYDGICIWVIDANDNNVIRLLAADGSPQGTFAVGNTPNSLVYDGSSIWVCNYGDNTVTRIRLSDWPLGS